MPVEIDDVSEQTLMDKVVRLQDGLVSFSTGGGFDGNDATYRRLRREMLDNADVKDKLPDFVRRYRDLDQFWQFIKFKYGTYSERRHFIWDSFRPAIEYLEAQDRSPGVQPVGIALERFDPDGVRLIWQKALDRRISDPEGAITAARTLLETVCKHILEGTEIDYPDSADLPKLWALTAERLNLAPHQHQETVFKAILGNCQSIVANVGAIRNRIGDAHGQGKKPVKPKARHAELVVNLAGSMASFLIATWDERGGK